MKRVNEPGFKRDLGTVVSIRLSDADRKQLEDRARADDRDLSSTVRQILRQSLAGGCK